MKVIFNGNEYKTYSKKDLEQLIEAVKSVSKHLKVTPDTEHATVEDRCNQIITMIEDRDFEALKNIQVDPVNYTYSFKIIEKSLIEALEEEGYKYEIDDNKKGISVYVENQGKEQKVHISVKSPLPDEEGLYEGQGIYSENGKVRQEQLKAWNIVFEKNQDEYYTFDNLGNVTYEDGDN